MSYFLAFLQISVQTDVKEIEKSTVIGINKKILMFSQCDQYTVGEEKLRPKIGHLSDDVAHYLSPFFIYLYTKIYHLYNWVFYKMCISKRASHISIFK